MSPTQSVNELIIKCLENEGAEYIFGLPGEGNMRLVLAGTKSSIRFVLARHEQAASFMAELYGRLSGKAGVCTASFGPGAINLLMGVADAQANGSPLVAITTQAGLSRVFKEDHRQVDLTAMFRPVTKWADTVLHPDSVPEMFRKAFSLAQAERPGAVCLALPHNLHEMTLKPETKPSAPTHLYPSGGPSEAIVKKAARLISAARRPIILAGQGAVRAQAGPELMHLAERLQAPLTTTFMAKGIVSDKHPLVLGVTGVMSRDYENFGFDRADLVIGVGYELQELAPARINPAHDKRIIHIHDFVEDEDASYPMEACLLGDIKAGLTALTGALPPAPAAPPDEARAVRLHCEELEAGEKDNSFPLKPQRIICDIRKAMGESDLAVVDNGSVKMWMAILYQCWRPLTCVFTNGFSPMAFALPGAVGAKLARPKNKVLAVMGDAAFMMNSQELETARREKIPIVVLIWEDHSFGLVKWRMDVELGAHAKVDFDNPNFAAYAASLGVKGCRVTAASELLPSLAKALADDCVWLISCPVDYRENMKLIARLGMVDRGF